MILESHVMIHSRKSEVSGMDKIKVTMYDRQLDSNRYRYVAHTTSLCGFGGSRQEAIGNLLNQINKHVPKDFKFTRIDLEVQDSDYFRNLIWVGLA
jgi:hypothetical protein